MARPPDPPRAFGSLLARGAAIGRALAGESARGGVSLTARVRRVWQKTLERMSALGGSSAGNAVTLFFDGDDAFRALLAAIAAARCRVWIESYIMAPDALGLAVIAAMTGAAARGVDVVLIVDEVGSSSLRPEHTAALQGAGGRVVRFNPLWLWTRRASPWVRDHRKIWIVDDVGFCGGMNIAEDYAGQALGNGRFRDTHALLEGPCVADLSAIHAATRRRATGEVLPQVERAAPLPRGVFAQVLGSHASPSRRHIQRALLQTVRRSVKSCRLTSPYFIPPPALHRSLRRAAKRGVDVQILTAGLSDVPIAAAAARHVYGGLLRAGVRVFEMQHHTLHAKTATVDGVYSSVGSFNLDRWSFERNLEVNVAFVDAGVARTLQERFAADLVDSREVELSQWQRRSWLDSLWGFIAHNLARL